MAKPLNTERRFGAGAVRPDGNAASMRWRKLRGGVNPKSAAVTRALVDDRPRAASDAKFEGLAFDARGIMNPRNLQKIWYVLGVVDLVEESFLVRVYVHACDEDIFRVDGHLQNFAAIAPPAMIVVKTGGSHPCRWSGHRTDDRPPRPDPAANDQ